MILTELSPPLGLLRLGTVARNLGVEVSILDFNLLYHLDDEFQDSSFYQKASEVLLAHYADVYGSTSMGIDSHIGLELARLVKEGKANTITVFGGPHFSSIANDLLDTYPWVDFVIEGEGETPFKELIEAHIKNKKHIVSELVGLQGRGSLFTSQLQNIGLRKLPFIDYDLVDLKPYFQVNPLRIFNFEGGRGCRYKCTFCYSPTHYSGFRDFDVETKLEEIYRLKKLGINHLFFVEDNFLNNFSPLFNSAEN